MMWKPGEFECVDDAMAAVLRNKSGAERFKIANDMFVSMRQMLVNLLRSEHPNWDARQIATEAGRRLLNNGPR
jgi:hypothetical protein